VKISERGFSNHRHRLVSVTGPSLSDRTRRNAPIGAKNKLFERSARAPGSISCGQRRRVAGVADSHRGQRLISFGHRVLELCRAECQSLDGQSARVRSPPAQGWLQRGQGHEEPHDLVCYCVQSYAGNRRDASPFGVAAFQLTDTDTCPRPPPAGSSKGGRRRLLSVSRLLLAAKRY
jgi:hypothetical protein